MKKISVVIAGRHSTSVCLEEEFLHELKRIALIKHKKGAKVLNSLSEFKDNLIFPSEITNKLTCVYIDTQDNHEVIDYQGNTYLVQDKTGCCFTPASYELGKSLDYADLISDLSSKRAIYKEG